MKRFGIVLLLVCCVKALAEANTVPDVDPLSALLDLVMHWGATAPLVLASTIVTILVQVFKRFFPTFPYTKFVVVIGGVVYGVIQSLSTGMTFINAVVFALLTSGGSVAIYELFKTPLNAVSGIKK
jgi:hypothetical protein